MKWLFLNLQWRLVSLLGICKHSDRTAIDAGPLTRGGHSLAAGAVVGHWVHAECDACGCKQELRFIA